MEWVSIQVRSRRAACSVLALSLGALTLSGCASLQNFPGREGVSTSLPDPPPSLRPPDDSRPPPSPPVVAQAPAPPPAPVTTPAPPAPPPPNVVQAPPAPAPATPVTPPVAAPPVVPQSPRPAAVPPARMPTLPMTQMDERVLAADLDNRAFTLTLARPIAIQDLLLLLVRGTRLSVVPDPAITGSFIGDLKDVTVREALNLILQPLGLDYTVAGGFIRVFRREPEMRLFDVNYIATQRTATSTVGTGPLGLSGQAGARAGSASQVSSTTASDLFADLAKGAQALLSDRGTLSVDRKAGLLQVIDFPERIERVAAYLDAVHTRVHRQVQIEFRVLDVELNDSVPRIDWDALSQVTIPGAAVSSGAPRALTGLRVTDISKLLEALATQGKVSTIADPRVLVLNNEPAIVRAGARRHGDVTLTVTPQIGANGVVMLSLVPLLSQPAATSGPRQKDKNADGDMLIEVDTVARVMNGETIVLTGFPTSSEQVVRAAGKRNRGRPPMVTKKRTELLILVTPRILNATAD